MTSALFVVDAGKTFGLGHLRRCAALAGELCSRDIECIWLLSDVSMRVLIAREGMTVVDRLEPSDPIAPVNIIVRDRRQSSDDVPNTYVGSQTVRCVIDDLAQRPIDADIVVNPNCYGGSLTYDVPEACQLLRGLAYSLVAPGFAALRQSRDALQNRRILITFGGTDDGRFGAAIADMICAGKVAQPSDIDLVLSPVHPTVPSVAPLAAAGVTIHRDADMAALYGAARMVIGGASVTMAEAAVAGVSAIACCIADDQFLNASALRKAGLPVFDQFDPTLITAAAADLIADGSSNPLTGMIDGQGAARVADAIVAVMTCAAET